MDTQSNLSLKQTWQAQIREVAARDPRLAHQLWQNRQVYFARFAHFYQQLTNLPRKFRRKFLRRLATTLAGAALLLALGQALPARAATITVDGVTCTLAEAITSANNDNAAGNGCVDGNGADNIDLQTDVTLSALLPQITSEITLEGNGHILDGNDSFQVLYVQATGHLTLNNTTIAEGRADYGGGIHNQGILEVNNSTLSGNFADEGGGIWNNGTAKVNNSTLSGNASFFGGGGIRNKYNGTMTVENSTLNDNHDHYFGGGVYNSGSLAISNSTLSGNSTFFSGGGIYNGFNGTVTVNNSTFSGNDSGFYGGGGGILNAGTATLNNSTLSGNSAYYGGGITNYGTLTVNNSTLSGNYVEVAYGGGGGIRNGGTMNLNQSLISGNSADYGAEVYNKYGTVNANNYNVIGYSGDARSSGFTPGELDIIPPGALKTVLHRRLADNGGPTFTHALVPGSVAIDAVPDAACLAPPINGLDQRGFPRNVDGDGAPSFNECDAGALEYASVNPSTPTPTATARPTRTPTPTPTAFQGSNLVSPPEQQVTDPFLNVFIVIILSVGNLIWFRKWRA
jgi:hypothetical protein